MSIFKKNKRTPNQRYNINQTLVNTTYQPKRPSEIGAKTNTLGDFRPQPLTNARPTSVPAPHSTPKKKRKKLTWTKRKAFAAFVLLLISPLIFIGTWDAINISRASNKMFGSGNLVSMLNANQVKESNDERVNVLMIGYSADDPGHGGASLTDSIIVLSLSTSDKKGYMLSIPRDLYVSIPNYGQAKINEAYQAGGPSLLKQTINESMGIPIHYHVVIDYKSVKDTVDSLNGITVNISSEDPRGVYDPNFKPEEGGPLKLANGNHKIDGETALKLTRARGSTFGSYGFPRSDFNRSENQRKVMAAIKERIGLRLVLDPRVNSEFFNAIANNVKTDIKASEILTLYRLYSRVPANELKSVSLHDYDKKNYYTGYTTPFGQSALIPAAGTDNYSEIKAAIKELNQNN
jgi:polyisoprenyl-teichoic acid--peptidoglycan teichoic acid transferase